MNSILEPKKQLVKYEDLESVNIYFRLEIINPPDFLREFWDVEMTLLFEDDEMKMSPRQISEVIKYLNSDISEKKIIRDCWFNDHYYVKLTEVETERNLIPDFEADHRVGWFNASPLDKSHRSKIIDEIKKKIIQLEFDIVDYKYSNGIYVRLNRTPIRGLDKIILI